MLSVFERTHELGLLRAVGMKRRQVREMIRSEAVIIAVFGAVIGVVIGTALGVAFAASLKQQGITEIAIPVAGLMGFLVLAALLGLVAASWPARIPGNRPTIRMTRRCGPVTPKASSMPFDARCRAWSTSQRRRRNSSTSPSGRRAPGSGGAEVTALPVDRFETRRAVPTGDKSLQKGVGLSLVPDKIVGARALRSSDAHGEQTSRLLQREDVFVGLVVPDVKRGVATGTIADPVRIASENAPDLNGRRLPRGAIPPSGKTTRSCTGAFLWSATSMSS